VKTVLIVEDEEVLSDLLTVLLEDEGYNVTAVPNGKAGLTSLQKTAPDLIITDLMMPVLDGLGFCRAIRSMPEYRAIPLVLLSAVSDRLQSGECSWSAIVRKPFNVDVLLKTVSHLVGST
jgi:CheY-like chemotaxis protein